MLSIYSMSDISLSSAKGRTNKLKFENAHGKLREIWCLNQFYHKFYKPQT